MTLLTDRDMPTLGRTRNLRDNPSLALPSPSLDTDSHSLTTPILRSERNSIDAFGSPSHASDNASLRAPPSPTLSAHSFASSSGSIRWTNSTVLRDNNPEGYDGLSSLYLAPPPQGHRRKGSITTVSSIGRSSTSQSQVFPINMLPDDVLLAVFDFCVDEWMAWRSLVHVCRRWRGVVLGSPRRLNLRLVCTPRTSVRGMLDVWPALPVHIRDFAYITGSLDNILALLEHSDRVYQISLMDVTRAVTSSRLEKLWAAMEKPFPELTRLELRANDESVPVLPDSFLGGSAPHLQLLELNGIPFPGFPKLLLSTTNLASLHLLNIPHSMYLSPKAMVTALSVLTNLEFLCLLFKSPQSCPDWESRHPPPLTRSVLPALTWFDFKGVSEYLDVLVARIDVPRLKSFNITLFNQIDFDTPQLAQFICRTPTLKLEKACVIFEGVAARVQLSPQTSDYGGLDVKISCGKFDWQVSSLEQVCTSSLPPLFSLEDLYLYKAQYLQPVRQELQDNVENALWRDLLHPFTAVKNLYLSKQIVQHIVPAMKVLVGSRTTEVLPALQNIFLERPQSPEDVQKTLRRFVSARRVTGHPIAITHWKRDWEYDPEEFRRKKERDDKGYIDWENDDY